MHANTPLIVTLALACVLPTPAHAHRALSPVYGPALPSEPSPTPEAAVPAEPIDAPEPAAPPEAEVPTESAPEAEVPTEPAPEAEVPTEPSLPPPTVVGTPHDDTAIVRAERLRDTGAGAMAVSGGFTVAGVILILAGAGATAAAIGRSNCGDECATTKDVQVASRVTAAGLVFSTLGSVGLLSSMIVYGVGRDRLARARHRW
jgi:hypothetical protein